MSSQSPPKFHALGIPASSATVSLRVFNVIDDPRAVSVPAGELFQAVPAGHEAFGVPVFAFLVEHTDSGRRVMFDLGVRKDLENAAPPIAAAIKAGSQAIPVSRDITEQLVANGIELASISAAIWSHSHCDHVGDMSKFPAETDIVFGGATILETHAVNPKSTLLESDLAGHKLVPLDFSASSLEIGGFKAHDFFGDGSFYVLDVPGHLEGHVAGLARVTPDSFVFLGGDSRHHVGMLRPATALHRHFPCPGALLASARDSISPTHFTDPHDANGRFGLGARTTPLLNVADGGMYVDPETARASLASIGAFDANGDVFVAIAHDETLLDVLGPLPASLNGWKEKGWKSRVTWAFVDKENPAFRFADKDA